MKKITLKKQNDNLRIKDNFRKINYDRTTANNETINKVILRFQKENLLSKNISQGIKTENPKTSQFYLKSKIYKEDNPGRPVISLINILITNFNQLLKKSHRTSKIQPTFLEKLTKFNLFQTTHTFFL